MDALERKKKKARKRWKVPMITLMVLFVLIALPNMQEGSNVVYWGFIGLFLVYFLGGMLVEKRISKWRSCPKCQAPEGIITESVVIKAATIEEGGNGIHKIRCQKCGHEWEEPYEIPCLAKSSSDDDRKSSRRGGSSRSWGGGSWGGGSSSGGGAGRSF